MKIRDIDTFQVSWAPDDKPQQRSAFVRVHTDEGLSGIGEASPMQGGIVSLGIKRSRARQAPRPDRLAHQ